MGVRVPFVMLSSSARTRIFLICSKRARRVAAGTLKTLPLRDQVAAISVGIVDGEAMLDLAYEEDSRAEVDMNFVMTGSNRFIELQATAEQVPFTDDQLAKMTALARKGIRELLVAQRNVVGELKFQPA